MKTKISLLLLFLCLLPLGMRAQDVDKGFWTDDKVLASISIGGSSESHEDVLVSDDNKEYTIYTAKGLAWIAKVTNEGLIRENEGNKIYYPESEGFMGCNIKLGDEVKTIDLSKHYWMPIGIDSYPFQGTFDGQGNRIVGVNLQGIKFTDNGNIYYLGLFGLINNSKVSNLGVEIDEDGYNININKRIKRLSFGGIIGHMDYNSSISNCYIYSNNDMMVNANDNIKSFAFIGGLVGTSTTGCIINCYSMINITVDKAPEIHIGGIVGASSYSVSYCYTTSKINVINPSKNVYVGGIVGHNLTDNTVITSNNIALNTEVTIKGAAQGKAIRGGKIGYNEKGTFINNYVSPKFNKIEGITSFDNSDNGTPISPNKSIKEILSPAENPDNPWEFPTDGGLPYLNTFDRDVQGAGQVNGRDYIDFSMTLKDDLTDDGVIYLNYDETDGWYSSKKDGADKQVFSGEINTSTIKKGLYIKGGDDQTSTPTLKIIGNLDIITSIVPAMDIHRYVNIDIDEGKSLYIKGLQGLKVNSNSNVSINQPSTKSRIGSNINIIGDQGEGIYNHGKLNINVDKITVQSIGDNSYSIVNENKFFINRGEMTVEGTKGLSNSQSSTFDISTATVHINITTDDAIKNDGFINIINNGTLKVETPSNSSPIKNDKSSSKFIVDQGSALLTWKKVDSEPQPSTIKSIDAGSGSLAVTEQNGVILKEGAILGAGSELRVKPSGYSKDIEAIVFTDDANNVTEVSDMQDKDYYSYIIPAGNVSISVKLKESKPEPAPDPDPNPNPNPSPVITYIVTVPEIEGVDTDPDPGEYEVESWSSFFLTLTLDSAYNQSQPVVTTSHGETISPRPNDGIYVIQYVRSDVDVYIEGIFKNPDPVGNEILNADAVCITACDGGVLIHTPLSAPCAIYSPGGQLLLARNLPAGDTRIGLSSGIYIIRVGEVSAKVRI